MKAKVKMMRSLVTMIGLLLAVSLSAQKVYRVGGTIADHTGVLLIGAHVQLLSEGKAEKTGTTTDEKGVFSLSVPSGDYTLEISYIGYAKYATQVKVDGNVSLPPIALSEDSQLMDAVVVTAKTVTYNASGYIAEISKNPLYREQDMSSILKLTPGTHTTHDKIQVYGQEVSKVYLNGRELQLSGERLINYLATLEGKNIKQMEIIAASGVEEDANTMGSSIIKITTINPETGGMLNAGFIGALYGDEGERRVFLPNVNLNWRLGKKWGTYFNGSFAYNETANETLYEVHFHDSDTRLSSESAKGNRNKGSYNALWGLSYDLNPNNLFSFEASYSNYDMSHTSREITRRTTAGQTAKDAEGTMDNASKSRTTNLSFIYTRKFGNDNELNFQADRLERHTDATNNNHYLYTGGDESANNNLSDEKHLLYTVRLDYTQRFKKSNGQLKIGVKYSNISDGQDMDYAYFTNGQKDLERSYTDLYKYSEEVYAAYAKYSFKVKKFDFNAGLRLEHALLSPRSSSNPELSKESTHTDWAPELGINYAINKEKGHNIALQYHHSISRPFFSFLNPNVIRQSEYYYWSGNPLLGPTARDHYTLRTTLFNGYTLALSHSYTDDGIIDLPVNKGGIIHSTPQTGMKSSGYSAYIGIPVKLKQWGQLNLSATYSYSESSYREAENSSDQWSFAFSGLFRLPKDFNINVDCSYDTPRKSLYGQWRNNRMLASVRISKPFLNRSLNVTLMFNDLFNNMNGGTGEFHYDSHSQISKSLTSNFNCMLNVRYTLRWGQKSMVRRGGSGNMEESSRLGN